MTRYPFTAFAAISAGLVLASAACAHNTYLCPPVVPSRNLDSLMNGLGGPPRLYSDSSASVDSIWGVVLESVRRVPVKGAHVNYRPHTSQEAQTDSAGRFSLPVLSTARAVLEVRAVGFAGRRDTVQFSRLRHHRLELTLLDAWALGDIEAVPVCTPVGRSPKPRQSIEVDLPW
jgi:hypothetical protein